MRRNMRDSQAERERVVALVFSTFSLSCSVVATKGMSELLLLCGIPGVRLATFDNARLIRQRCGTGHLQSGSMN
jgi:hypothetical protein